MTDSKEKIAVIIPCHNEAETIEKVVRDFHAALPEAEIHVFDNASTDHTTARAQAAGAKTHFVASKGKGNVVRAMFTEIDADIFIMADGDDTYPAEMAPQLLNMIRAGQAEMIVGNRLQRGNESAFRRMHLFGNRIITWAINLLFGSRIEDALSGFRAFSGRFVRNTPILATGFEVETELTLTALDNGFRIVEVPISYRKRPAGSHSKLSTIRDGTLLLMTIITIFRDYRPLAFFGIGGLLVFATGLVFGFFVIGEFTATGKVTHPSTAALSASLCVAGLLSIMTGFVLDSIKRYHRSVRVLLAGRPR